MLELVAQFFGAERLFGEHPVAVLPPLVAGNADYMVRLCVELHEPHVADIPRYDAIAIVEAGVCWQERPPDPPMIGYFVEIGLRTEPLHVIPALERAVTDGTIHWGRTKWHEVPAGAPLERKVRRHFVPIAEAGIWYLGEREYFHRWF